METIRRRRLARGELHDDVEELLATNAKTHPLMALALFDDERRTDDVLPRLKKIGKWSADVFQAMKAGVTDFIEKPFDDEVMLRAIRSAIAAHAGDDGTAAERREVIERIAKLSGREREVMEGLVAGQAKFNDGPWQLPEDYKGYSGLIKYSVPLGKGDLKISLNGFKATWNPTEQTPERVIGTPPQLASSERLEAIGAAARRLERALDPTGPSPFTNAMRGAVAIADALWSDVEGAYLAALE